MKKRVSDRQVDKIVDSKDLTEGNVEILTNWVEQTVADLDRNKILSYEQAQSYLNVERHWLDEILLTGELKSLSVEHLDEYMSNCTTEIIDITKK